MYFLSPLIIPLGILGFVIGMFYFVYFGLGILL
jgi:hypothetical protein